MQIEAWRGGHGPGRVKGGAGGESPGGGGGGGGLMGGFKERRLEGML